jgi:hypothetical protein
MQCATHAGILSSVISTAPFGTASQTSGTLSYPSYLDYYSLSLSSSSLFSNQPEGCSAKKGSEEGKKVRSHSFGDRLDPRWIVGALSHSTSELLRTL